jgi:hypothetical protein
MMKRQARGFLLSVLSLAIAACLFWYWSFLQESSAPAEIAMRMAASSQPITKALGGVPLNKRYVTGHVLAGPDYGNADLTIHLAGPTAKGKLFEWAQNGLEGWHICSLGFVDEAGNNQILVSDESTTCERE